MNIAQVNERSTANYTNSNHQSINNLMSQSHAHDYHFTDVAMATRHVVGNNQGVVGS